MKNITFMAVFAFLASIFSNIVMAQSLPYSSTSVVPIQYIPDTIKTLDGTIKNVAEQTLAPKINCHRNFHCKSIATGTCGTQYVKYSTYRNTATKAALEGMVMAKGKLLLQGMVHSCAQPIDGPPTQQCIEKKCVVVPSNSWMERTFPR